MTDTASLAAAWIDPGATVVAVGAAIYAGAYAKKTFGKEVERDDERDEARRRAQADKVAAWCDRYDYSPAVPPRPSTERSSGAWCPTETRRGDAGRTDA